MEIVDRRVPLAEIGKTAGPAPVPRFVANVRRHGVVIPILLREVVANDGSVTYRIVDGNRRIAAAREVGLRELPARVLAGVSVDEAARLVLLANNFRSANEITEYWAIRHLQQCGASRQSVADDGGFEVRYLHQRDRWGELDRRLFTGYSEGRIPSSIATKIVRMKPDDQRSFGDLFEDRGRILSTDLDEYRRDRTPPGSPSAAPGAELVNAGSGGEQWAPEGGYDPSFADVSRDASFDVTVTAKGPSQHLTRTLESEVQQAVETLAELGCMRGYSLDDLAHALEAAYRRMAVADTEEGDEARGPDQ